MTETQFKKHFHNIILSSYNFPISVNRMKLFANENLISPLDKKTVKMRKDIPSFHEIFSTSTLLYRYRVFSFANSTLENVISSSIKVGYPF